MLTSMIALALLALTPRAFALVPSSPSKLRSLLASDEILVMPCCYDGLTARMVDRAGFPLTFMTGFGVAAAHGFPDTGLLSFGEMRDQAAQICGALSRGGGGPCGGGGIPCIADGDTGYGNGLNVRRTVQGFADAGMAGVMIEDQVAPKRCGHVAGKQTINRHDAVARIKAAVMARDEYGPDAGPLIVARTDARGTEGLAEALHRCQAFRDAGADVTFLEAPQSVEEMARYCDTVDGPCMANMLEGGVTPRLPPAELEAMGYKIAAYPLTLLSATLKAQEAALAHLKAGTDPSALLLPFEATKDRVGFTEYAQQEAVYAALADQE